MDNVKNYNLEISHINAIENLKSDTDDFIKIFSIINISHLNSPDEFYTLISYLTDNPDPLREVCAYKLEELYSKNLVSYFNEDIKNKLFRAISDINPNVSKAICSIIKANKEVAQNLEYPIIEGILEKLSAIELKKSKNSHARNKKLFSLYWLMEALCYCVSEKYSSKVLEILNVTINFDNYTIREKTAKILTLIKNPPQELLNLAKNDQNFYVKNQVYGKIVNETR